MIKLIILGYFLLFLFLTTKRPGSCLAGWLICYLGLEQWAIAQDPFFGQHSALLNYITAALITYGFCVAVARADKPIEAGYSWTYLTLYTFSLLSYAWTIDRASATMVLQHAAPYMFFFVGVLPFTMNKFEDLRSALLWLILAGAVVSFACLILDISSGGRGIAFEEGVVNRYGEAEFTGNPLAIGTMGGMVAFAAAMFRFEKVYSRFTMAVCRWVIVAIGLALVFKSGSRGQLLGVGMTMPIFMLCATPKVSPKNVIFAVVGLILVASIGYWATSFIPDQITARWQTDSMVRDYDHRIYMCQTLLAEWSKGSPFTWLFGLGIGASWKVVGFYPHVIPVQVLGEFGLVGLTLYIIFYVCAVYSWVMLYKATKNQPENRAAIAILGAFACFQFLLSLKQGAFSGGYTTFLYPLLVIRFHQIAMKAKKRARLRSPRRTWAQPVPTPL